MKNTISKEQMALRLIYQRKKDIEIRYKINETNCNDSFAHRNVETMKAAVKYRELKAILDSIEDYPLMSSLMEDKFKHKDGMVIPIETLEHTLEDIKNTIALYENMPESNITPEDREVTLRDLKDLRDEYEDRIQVLDPNRL